MNLSFRPKIFIFTFAWLIAAPALGDENSCRSIFHRALESGPYSSIANVFERARLTRAVDPALAEQIISETVRALRKSEVVKVEKLGGGQTASFKVTLANGMQAVYKPINPERPNMIHREVTAFKISRLMTLDIVPPTVVRKINGVKGSFQLFIETATPLEKNKVDDAWVVYKNGRVFPVENFISGRRLRVFDWLINNHDRGTNAGNYLVSNLDGFIMGIDNSTSFVGHDRHAREDKVPFYKQDYLRDRELFDLLRKPTREELTEALENLNPVRVPEFFERYDQLLRDAQAVLSAR